MIILHFAWTRFGLRRFLRKIEGARLLRWRVARLEFKTGLLGLRWLCLAELEREV